jgi:hypothetical protein
MKLSRSVLFLASAVGVLSLVTSAVGLLWHSGGEPFDFRTVHGQHVRMFGDGVYRFDSLQRGAIFRGTDAVVLFLCIPALVASLVHYRRGSLRASVILCALLGYFLYNAASVAFGAAYNQLFLVYIALFSVSLFAFLVSFASIDLALLGSRLSPDVPRRSVAVFLTLAGLVLLLVWLGDIVSALRLGRMVPTLESYTTEVTYVLDLGVIVPVAVLSAILVLRRASLGYLLACIMLILNTIIGVVVVAQTISMASVGLRLTPGQLIAYVGSFLLLSLVAAWFATRVLRGLEGAPTPPRQT